MNQQSQLRFARNLSSIQESTSVLYLHYRQRSKYYRKVYVRKVKILDEWVDAITWIRELSRYPSRGKQAR